MPGRLAGVGPGAPWPSTRVVRTGLAGATECHGERTRMSLRRQRQSGDIQGGRPRRHGRQRGGSSVPVLESLERRELLAVLPPAGSTVYIQTNGPAGAITL